MKLKSSIPGRKVAEKKHTNYKTETLFFVFVFLWLKKLKAPNLCTPYQIARTNGEVVRPRHVQKLCNKTKTFLEREIISKCKYFE